MQLKKDDTMMQNERRILLIKELLKEQPEYNNVKIPKSIYNQNKAG